MTSNRRTKQRLGIGVATIAVAAALGMTLGGSPASAYSDLTDAQRTQIADAWTACMADAGLEATISLDAGVDIDIEVPDGMTDETALALEADCESVLAPVEAEFELEPAEQATLTAAVPALRDCLADTGYVVTVTADGGVDLNSNDQPDGFDEDVYLKAEDDCYKQVVPDLYAKYVGE